jgi:hypothetical protein
MRQKLLKQVILVEIVICPSAHEILIKMYVLAFAAKEWTRLYASGA